MGSSCLSDERRTTKLQGSVTDFSILEPIVEARDRVTSGMMQWRAQRLKERVGCGGPMICPPGQMKAVASLVTLQKADHAACGRMTRSSLPEAQFVVGLVYVLEERCPHLKLSRLETR